MKVQDIRSFFKHPTKSGASAVASPEVIEVPSRRRKAKSVQKSNDSHSDSDGNKANSDGEQEEKDSKRRKRRKLENDGSSVSKRRKPPVINDDSDEDEPESLKKDKKQGKRRKPIVLSDSDEEDEGAKKSNANGQQKNTPNRTPIKPIVTPIKKTVKKVEPIFVPVDVADFFGSAPVKQSKLPTPVKRDLTLKMEPALVVSPSQMEPTLSESNLLPFPDFSGSDSAPVISSFAIPPIKTDSSINGSSASVQHSPKQEKLNLISTTSLQIESSTTSPPLETSVTSKVPSPSISMTVPKEESSVLSSKKEPSVANPLPKEESSYPSDPLPEDEPTNPLPVEELASPLPKEESSDPLRKEESSDPLPKEESSDPLPKEESSDPLPKEESSDPLPKEESSDPLPKEESSDPLRKEESSDPLPKVESSDPLPKDEPVNLLSNEEPANSLPKRKSSTLSPKEESTNPLLQEKHLDPLHRKESSNPLPKAETVDPLPKEEPSTSNPLTEAESANPLPKEESSSPLPKEEPAVMSPVKKSTFLFPRKETSDTVLQKGPSLTVPKIKIPLASVSVAQPCVPASQLKHSGPSLMWVDKYKPKALKDIVGQIGETSNAKRLLKWLQNWFNFHGSSADKPKASWPGLKDPEGKTFKCALLSGPPGIGKTTTAHLACREVGYDYFEMNASDTRNKKGLHENVADALSSKCITFGNKKDELTRKHVLIMDEVDGMSGNEDRGGVQELIGLLKTSRIPIICICNDRNHPKIRSLANYCFDLKFSKPSLVQLKSLMMSMCFKEKIKVPSEKMQQLITSTDMDVRQIIHQLQMYKEADSDAAYNPKKDLTFGPWDVVRKVFSAADRVGMSIDDKTGLFFQDYNIGPLFVQENYVRYVPQAAKGNVYKHMDLLHSSAKSIADGDLVDSVLRRTNNWSLLPVQAIFSSYAPGEYMDGHCSSSPQFPMWLGKNSNKNKRARILQQLHNHMHLNISGSLEALNMEYLPYLRRSIVNPLANGEIQDAAQKMEVYTLLREDLDNINDVTLWPGMRNNMDKIDSKVKASFTRQVNKEVLPYSAVKVTKTRGKGAKNDEELDGMDEEEELADGSEDEDTLDKDAMVKIKNKPTSKKSVKSSVKKTSDADSEEDRKPGNKSKRGRKNGSSQEPGPSKKSKSK